MTDLAKCVMFAVVLASVSLVTAAPVVSDETQRVPYADLFARLRALENRMQKPAGTKALQQRIEQLAQRAFAIENRMTELAATEPESESMKQRRVDWRPANAVERPITLKMQDAKCRHALSQIVHCAGLQYRLQDGSVYIATRDRLGYQPTLVFYDISGIAPEGNAERLAGVVQTVLIALEGNSASEVTCHGARLIIRAIPPAHQTIRKLLRGLGSKPEAIPEPDAPPWRKKIEDQLDSKTISFDFVDTPLHDVIAWFQSKSGVSIVLDPHALAVKK